MENFDTVEAVLENSKKAIDGLERSWSYGYADGLTAVQHYSPIDWGLQKAQDAYARGYSAGFYHGRDLRDQRKEEQADSTLMQANDFDELVK